MNIWKKSPLCLNYFRKQFEIVFQEEKDLSNTDIKVLGFLGRVV